MTLVDSTARNLTELGSEAPAVSDDEWARQFNCIRCQDTGFDFQAMLAGRGSIPCVCRLEKIRLERFQTAVRLTPRKFNWITDGLNSVPEMPDVHPRQPKILQQLRRAQNSEKSYFFWGKTGTHKTTLALALMQEAGRRGEKVSYEVGRSLIDNIRNFQINAAIPADKAIYSLEHLETTERLCLLIDEIEDTASSLTSYTLSILFGVVERCQAFEHQLLITSNTSLERLLEKWIIRDKTGEADAENYANKIGRRISEMCVKVDFS